MPNSFKLNIIIMMIVLTFILLDGKISQLNKKFDQIIAQNNAIAIIGESDNE